MRFQGSVLKEQGVTFGVVVVKKHVVDVPSQAREAIVGFSSAFGGIPTVLVAQDSSGRAYWYGRTDIINYMRNVPLSAIPWNWYDLN
jgi:predicted GIY-YIG superfamily endonuclease